MSDSYWQQRPVCWLSSARYLQPLDATTARKWHMLAKGLKVDMRIIGFSESIRPRRFTEHVHFYLLPQPPTSILRYLTIFLLMPLLASWLVVRHDVQVFVAQSPFEGAVGAVAKRLFAVFGRRIDLIVENHNNFEEDVFLQRRIVFMGLYRRLMLAAARYAFYHADALRVISSSTAERAQYYAPKRPMVRFMTWSDTDIFLNTPRSVKLSDTYDIVYAGVLIPRKGVHHLLAAFAQVDCPQANLYLVGHPENATYTAELKAQAQELGISEQVFFVGGVSQAELAAYLSRARVMVLPSLSEGLGRVVVEAMLCHTPVIASRVGGIPDMIRGGENGYLVPPEDVDALHNALQQIMDTDDIEAMGKNAYQFATDFFSPQAYVDGYRQLLRIVGEDRQPAQRI